MEGRAYTQKLNLVQLLRFPRPSIYGLYFIYARKFYVHTQHWKSTLSRNVGAEFHRRMSIGKGFDPENVMSPVV